VNEKYLPKPRRDSFDVSLTPGLDLGTHSLCFAHINYYVECILKHKKLNMEYKHWNSNNNSTASLNMSSGSAAAMFKL